MRMMGPIQVIIGRGSTVMAVPVAQWVITPRAIAMRTM